MKVETEVGVSTVTIESIEVEHREDDVERVENRGPMVSLANNLPTAIGAWVIWVIIAVMIIATLTFLGLGLGGN